MMKFLKNLFSQNLFSQNLCSCNCNKSGRLEESLQDNVSAKRMLHVWNPYQTLSMDKLKGAFQRVFLSSDGQKALQHLTNIAFMGKNQVNNDIAQMAFGEGKQAIVLTIFDMLKSQYPSQYPKTPK